MEETIDDTPQKLNNPAISVIIPMYNAEKYIGECLDSLMAQTFQDFEVILVDDCSTDSCYAIAESYIPKFNGRLKLTKTEINSGGCAVPRNVGLPLSNGEYVFFMDSDDALTKTGLEEMYTLAKKYDADVVYCERYYMSTGVGEEFITNTHPATRRVQSPPYVRKPTLESYDLFDRIQGILDSKFYGTAWLKLVRYKLLDEHKISFSLLKPGEDDIWNYRLIFFAEKWLRVPNIVYIRRMREDSIMGMKRTPKQSINFYLNPIVLGLKELDELMSQIPFFQQNPQQRYSVLENHFRIKLSSVFKNAGQLTSAEVYETIKNEFGDNLGEYDTLVSALCTQIFNQDKSLKIAENIAKEAESNMQVQNVETKRLKDAMSYIFEVCSICPAVSVIIPLYNSEKYIGECLDSILAQTFQSFEVIVVDDCSTDDSVKVVESYLSKFKGKLKITKTEKNTGSPGDPGNIGVAMSRGEYLFILDDDDTITPDALEKLYHTAKEFNADVVSCEAFYWIPEEHWNDFNFRRNLKPVSYQKCERVTKPTTVPFDVTKRIKDCYNHKFLWSLWQKLIRRDYIIENEIRFTNNIIQDMVATCCLIYTAKIFVRVPYAVNYYRVHNDSLFRKNRTPLQQLQKYLSALNVGLKYLNNFLSKRKFFQENPEVKQLALKTYFYEVWDKYVIKIYDKVPMHEREEALRKEFVFNDKIEELMPFIFELLFKFIKENQIPPDLEPFITARVDLQLIADKTEVDTETDILILSATDDANILSPVRKNNSVIYQVRSHAGKMEIYAKATLDGKFHLWLRGMDIRNPEDKSKRIPYWIDYTNLTVNGKTLFNTVTPIWHDKPYRYNMNVKADEEVKIKLEWLPHRSDTAEQNIAEIKEESYPIPLNFKPFLTSRIDIKLLCNSTKGNFKILSVSDDKANITKPKWFQSNGIGYVISSLKGTLSFVVKAAVDGQINLKLKSLNIKDSEKKAIPYWIDYTSLTINGETLLNTVTPAWHDEPYIYNMNVKADEEVKIEVEWLPHRCDTIEQNDTTTADNNITTPESTN